MRSMYDLSPLYRSMIGVDRMADMIETAMRSEGEANGYPPYDIEKTDEDAYRITVAVAGFRPDELEVTSQPNMLVISGRRAAEAEDRQHSYLHRGIAARAFERRFELADYVVVRSAACADGVLTVDLAREVPEALKPRRIEIGAGGGTGGKVERLESRASGAKAA